MISLQYSLIVQFNLGRAGMAQWRQHSLPTNVTRVPGAICGLSLLLVLVPAPRVFSRFSSFSLSTKTNTSKFQYSIGNSRATGLSI